MFVRQVLAFPDGLVSVGQAFLYQLHCSPSLLQGQVIESDIDGTACPMVRPFVVLVEGVMGRCDGQGEVRAEDFLEGLDDKHQAFFEVGGQFHYDSRFLKGVLHDVFMVWACLDRDFIVGFGLVLFGGILPLVGFGLDRLGPQVFGLGSIWVMHHLVGCNEHDADEDKPEKGFEHVFEASVHDGPPNRLGFKVDG